MKSENQQSMGRLPATVHELIGVQRKVQPAGNWLLKTSFPKELQLIIQHVIEHNHPCSQVWLVTINKTQQNLLDGIKKLTFCCMVWQSQKTAVVVRCPGVTTCCASHCSLTGGQRVQNSPGTLQALTGCSRSFCLIRWNSAVCWSSGASSAAGPTK